MFDIIFTIILLLIAAIINMVLNIQNVLLENFVNLIPLIILTIRIWYNRPRNYMYLLGMINRNVKYNMMIKLRNCIITEVFFDNLINNLKKLYGTNNGHIIKNNKGAFLWEIYLDVDSCLVEVTYNQETKELYVESKAKTKFKNFILDVEKIIDTITNLFSSTCYNYNSEIISIKIGYLNRKQKEIQNPILTKFFSNFDTMIMNLKYTAKGGTKFTITNNRIEILGTDLKNIKNDIRKEMLLF